MHYGTRVIIIIIRRRIYVQRGLQLQDYWPWCTAVVVNKVIIFLDKITFSQPTDSQAKVPSQFTMCQPSFIKIYWLVFRGEKTMKISERDNFHKNLWWCFFKYKSKWSALQEYIHFINLNCTYLVIEDNWESFYWLMKLFYLMESDSLRILKIYRLQPQTHLHFRNFFVCYDCFLLYSEEHFTNCIR